jgi:hypothetical protein
VDLKAAAPRTASKFIDFYVLIIIPNFYEYHPVDIGCHNIFEKSSQRVYISLKISNSQIAGMGIINI